MSDSTDELSTTLTTLDNPVSDQVIDASKLLRAWEASTRVQLDLVSVVKKNEADNRKTRRDNIITRTVATVSTGITVVVLLIFGVINYLDNAASRKISQGTYEKLESFERKLKAFALAEVAQIESKHAETLESGFSKLKKAEAELKTAQAAAAVADTQAEKQEATRNVAAAKKRARKVMDGGK